MEFDSDRDAATHITNDAEYNSTNLKARNIRMNHLKALRLNLAITLSGRKTNLNKAYRQDLFYMWSTEKEADVNMGVQVKKWLAS